MTVWEAAGLQEQYLKETPGCWDFLRTSAISCAFGRVGGRAGLFSGLCCLRAAQRRVRRYRYDSDRASVTQSQRQRWSVHFPGSVSAKGHVIPCVRFLGSIRALPAKSFSGAAAGVLHLSHFHVSSAASAEQRPAQRISGRSAAVGALCRTAGVAVGELKARAPALYYALSAAA